MGCVTSKAHEGPSTSRHQPVDPNSQSDKQGQQKSTRARRLSYVTTEQNIQDKIGTFPDSWEDTLSKSPNHNSKKGDEQLDDGYTQTKTKSTRARRLSYVTNTTDPSIVKKLSETGQEEVVDQDPAIFAARAKDKQQVPVMCNVACLSRAGREPGYRKTNQDNCFAFQQYIDHDQALFGAFDGHGPHGHLVSSYVKQHLPIILVQNLGGAAPVPKAMHNSFLDVQSALKKSKVDTELSGTTAVIALLKGTTLSTAWVGDSKAVLGRVHSNGRVQAIELTRDHKPNSPSERQRIVQTGGRVAQTLDEFGQNIGPNRVWLQYTWAPGLAMSRALGDDMAHQVGVTSEPDVASQELDPQDQYLVLASDGVWEFMTPQQAIDIVAKGSTPEEAGRMLVEESYQRWLAEEDGVVDDITVVVVHLIHQAPQMAEAEVPS